MKKKILLAAAVVLFVLIRSRARGCMWRIKKNMQK